MSNFNDYLYGTKEYYEEELKQETLIAQLVEEAIKNRVKNGDNSTPFEELSIAFFNVTNNVKSTKQRIAEQRIAELSKKEGSSWEA